MTKNGSNGARSSRGRTRPRFHHKTTAIIAGKGAIAVLQSKPKIKKSERADVGEAISALVEIEIGENRAEKK